MGHASPPYLEVGAVSLPVSRLSKGSRPRDGASYSGLVWATTVPAVVSLPWNIREYYDFSRSPRLIFYPHLDTKKKKKKNSEFHYSGVSEWGQSECDSFVLRGL